jgi:hypothetical protein
MSKAVRSAQRVLSKPALSWVVPSWVVPPWVVACWMMPSGAAR